MQRRIRNVTLKNIQDWATIIRKRLIENQLSARLIGVAGVPRGGLPLAVMMSHRMRLPFLTENPLVHSWPDGGNGILICEDIVDSGATAERIQKLNPAATLVALVAPQVGNRPSPRKTFCRFSAIAHNDDTWFVFPWEDYKRSHDDMRAYNSRMKREQARAERERDKLIRREV